MCPALRILIKIMPLGHPESIKWCVGWGTLSSRIVHACCTANFNIHVSGYRFVSTVTGKYIRVILHYVQFMAFSNTWLTDHFGELAERTLGTDNPILATLIPTHVG